MTFIGNTINILLACVKNVIEFLTVKSYRSKKVCILDCAQSNCKPQTIAIRVYFL